jgi:segregation and condensation protein A
VSASTIESPVLLGYQLRLPSFEGPFDLLLRLIERNQLTITDISLIAITDQFLAHVASMEEAPPQTIAEFASVGSRLVLLKSRSLLPRPPANDEEGDTGDLARQLIEYKAVKEAAAGLGDRDRRGIGAFARAAQAVMVPVDNAPAKLAAHVPGSLVRALRRRLAALPSPKELAATRPVVTLAMMIERVFDVFGRREKAVFSGVVRECRTDSEIRTAFLAVLVLVRRRLIDAEQETPFGEITMTRRTSHAAADAVVIADDGQ